MFTNKKQIYTEALPTKLGRQHFVFKLIKPLDNPTVKVDILLNGYENFFIYLKNQNKTHYLDMAIDNYCVHAMIQQFILNNKTLNQAIAKNIKLEQHTVDNMLEDSNTMVTHYGALGLIFLARLYLDIGRYYENVGVDDYDFRQYYLHAYNTSREFESTYNSCVEPYFYNAFFGANALQVLQQYFSVNITKVSELSDHIVEEYRPPSDTLSSFAT